VNIVFKTKAGYAVSTGSVAASMVISFFMAFREGVETVIFYQFLISFASIMNL
jgi:hypothetical protein